MEETNTQVQKTKQIQRQIAYKTWLSDLSSGNFTQGSKFSEGFSPNYVEVNDKKISRVNIIATVVDTFKSEDGNYFSFTLDDGSATIRLKAFNEDTNALLDIEKGDIVLVIARVREYQEEVYISPEITKKITDPNIQLIRTAELLKYLGKPKKIIDQGPRVLHSNLNHQEKTTNISSENNSSHEGLRQIIIELLTENEGTGTEVSIISKKIEKDDSTTETIIKELLLEGEIYENKPGHYKVI